MPADADEKSTNDKKFEFYIIAVDTRNFKITLFWQRSNYFLVLNSDIAIGIINLTDYVLKVGMAIFGLICSVLWFRVNIGSKYWQCRWGNRLSEIEKNH